MKNLLQRVCLCLLVTALSLTKPKAQELKKGDVCPDITVNEVTNYNKPSLSLSDFKDKILILDFWSINCLSCIEAFPKIDSLQKHFKGKLQLVLVSMENRGIVETFFKKHPKMKKPDVPFITSDSILFSYFPHSYVPIQAWIDGERKVIQVTDGYNATADNIKAAIERKDFKAIQLKYIPHYDYTKPAIAQGDLVNYAEFYSFLMRYVPGVDVGNFTESTENGKVRNRIVINGSSILGLYKTAYSEGGKYDFKPSNTVVLNVKGAENWTEPTVVDKRGEWLSQFAFNYEAKVPSAKPNSVYELMQRDLVTYFNATGKIEQRIIKCLKLVRSSEKDLLKTKGGNKQTNFFRINSDSLLFMENVPFQRLAFKLKTVLSNQLDVLFKDETGYNGNIDIKLTKDAFSNGNFQLLKKELLNYGLNIVYSECLEDVLVISK